MTSALAPRLALGAIALGLLLLLGRAERQGLEATEEIVRMTHQQVQLQHRYEFYCPREHYGRSFKAMVRHQPDSDRFWSYSCYFGRTDRKDVL